MKLFEYKVTDDTEPTRLYVAAATIRDASDVLSDHELGTVDWESVQPYLDGEKKPRAIRTLADIPEDFHDSVYIGNNEDEQTVSEFLEGEEED